jgi:hypothetical protein
MKTIIELHFMGGPQFMFTISLIFLLVILLAIIALVKLSDQSKFDRVTVKNLILSILYLGSFAAIWGIFGQGLGIYQALYAIQMAGDISPALIIGGIKVSMIAPLYGVSILLLSSMIWLGLKVKYNNKAVNPAAKM